MKDPLTDGFGLSDGKEEEVVYKVFGLRWITLAVYSFAIAANAMMWVTFAPISDIAQSYFDNGYYGSKTSVNMLANIFLILYGPGTVLSLITIETFQVRKSLIIACALTVFGAAIRCIATYQRNSFGPELSYIIMMVGQAFAALSQPMYLNLPPTIASIWFPPQERELAIVIGSMSSLIGNAIGQLIPVFLVTQHFQTDTDDAASDGHYNVEGMNSLMVTELVICVCSLLLTALVFADAPPSPPSQSTQLKIEAKERSTMLKLSFEIEEKNLLQHEAVDSETQQQRLSKVERPGQSDEAHTDIWRQLRVLMYNRDFLVLFFIFAICVGFFNSLMTLLNQIVGPQGYSNGQVGTLGAVFIVCGVVSSVGMGYVLEQTKAYRTIFKVGMVVGFLVNNIFLLMLYPNNFILLLLSFALLGFCVTNIVIVMLVNCAECTYPVPEELSVGLLFVGSNYLALIFIFIMQWLLEKNSPKLPFLPSNIFTFAMLGVASLVAQAYHGQYHRLEQDKLQGGQWESG